MKLRRASAAFGFRFVHGAVCSKTLRILLALFFGLLVYVLSQTIFKVTVETRQA
jgi:hypothetical protein